MKIVLLIILGIHTVSTMADIVNIPQMYQIVAEEKRVPTKLFYAIVLNESRSRVSSLKKNKLLPWPWTVNYKGIGHYFKSREKAYMFASSLLNNGDKNFDVGLGQMNWRWHEGRFNGLWEAFDPYTNLSAAAKHFREQYDRPECNSWELAVGCYHRPGQSEVDKELAIKYSQRVIKLWVEI